MVHELPIVTVAVEIDSIVELLDLLCVCGTEVVLWRKTDGVGKVSEGGLYVVIFQVFQLLEIKRVGELQHRKSWLMLIVEQHALVRLTVCA